MQLKGQTMTKQQDCSAFTLTHASATPDKAMAAVSNLEWIVGRIANGDRRAIEKLSVEDVAVIVQYVRNTANGPNARAEPDPTAPPN